MGSTETTRAAEPATPYELVLAGAKSMTPFLASVIPMGLAGGVLGLSSGLSGWSTLGLAMAVNSGTAQFVGYALLADGAGWITIILTTLILSLRLLIYSTILSPYVREVPQRWRVFVGFGLIDAVFFVVIDRLKKGKLDHGRHLFFLGASGVMYVTWMSCTAIGMALGSAVPDLEKLGLDFPMTAMFVAMLATGLANWRVAAVICTAGTVAMLARGLPYNLGVVLATVVGAVVGTVLEYAVRGDGEKPEQAPAEHEEEPTR
ncbi:AzlC family ABC transporter permease [Streptomyces cinnabarinus]|uniref:AzlC family ABC transporter permease n=1 Tax=Streptomyces cinnabarinus TaxID=67287 RepID=A0ABY7KGI0_9ACTN|nr:AzlC family ABC transporter permease [Streptomyces cinnabarinus]WAZ21836.1 AzlC family ABC transporter permease [Streptomyces cinnabarinus]